MCLMRRDYKHRKSEEAIMPDRERFQFSLLGRNFRRDTSKENYIFKAVNNSCCWWWCSLLRTEIPLFMSSEVFTKLFKKFLYYSLNNLLDDVKAQEFPHVRAAATVASILKAIGSICTAVHTVLLLLYFL